AQCHGKLGLGVRSRNVWNGRWWVPVLYCSTHCEAFHELERYDARAKHGRHAFIPDRIPVWHLLGVFIADRLAGSCIKCRCRQTPAVLRAQLEKGGEPNEGPAPPPKMSREAPPRPPASRVASKKSPAQRGALVTRSLLARRLVAVTAIDIDVGRAHIAAFHWAVPFIRLGRVCGI